MNNDKLKSRIKKTINEYVPRAIKG